MRNYLTGISLICALILSWDFFVCLLIMLGLSAELLMCLEDKRMSDPLKASSGKKDKLKEKDKEKEKKDKSKDKNELGSNSREIVNDLNEREYSKDTFRKGGGKTATKGGTLLRSVDRDFMFDFLFACMFVCSFVC